jgi:transcription elongation GreA/GreB family factor
MMRDDVRSRLERELAELEATERPRVLTLIGSFEGGDAADQAARSIPELELAHVEGRIHRLRNRLASLDRPSAQQGTGPVSGSTVILDFGDGPETYLLADFPHTDLPTITRESPLGRALSVVRGAGERILYETPRGSATVTLLGYEEHRATV